MEYKFKREQHLPEQQRQELVRSPSGPVALSWLFDEWMQGDEIEQRETFEILRRSLDEGRPAGYKLFPQA